MPTAIVAGIPRAWDVRLRAYLEDREGPIDQRWSVRRVRSRSDRYVTINLNRIEELLQGPASGAHVLAFRPRQDAQRVRKRLLPYFRFRWLRDRHLGWLPNNPDGFVQAIRQELDIEYEWRDSVAPDDPRSPLLIPRVCFSTVRRCRDMWKLADEAKDYGRIEAAARYKEAFRSHHFRSIRGGRYWMDEDDLVFDHQGERHGRADFPHAWKYSYGIPDGFHYDVDHKEQRAFRLRDSGGRFHDTPKGGYLNVDPHGHVR